MTDYHVVKGGLPGQSDLMTGRSVFTPAYAFLPRGVMRDIVTSALPFWRGARFWVIARPMSGFSETFSHYIADLSPGGGTERDEGEPGIQSAIFVTGGAMRMETGGQAHDLVPGDFIYLPPGQGWSVQADAGAQFHWIRKKYQAVEGLDVPDPFKANDAAIAPATMPDTDGRWATTRFMDPADLRHDMHITIVTLQPGAVIPFEETHVMEHGLYVLQGKGVYKLNQDWVEVEAGDYMWLRAFCPQACYAGGPGPFRYLLYKDVNRHMPLSFG